MFIFKGKKIKTSDYIVLLCCVMASLALLDWSNEKDQAAGFHGFVIDTMGELASPLGEFRNLLVARKEAKRLAILSSHLQRENERLLEVFEENKRLKKLLGFSDQSERFDIVPVNVIGFGGVYGLQTIILDGGIEKELRIDMPIVSADGLIGKIIKVGKRRSIGQLLIDRNFRVLARAQRSRDTGLFKWTGGDIGVLYGISKRADVANGDIVISSGLNSLYPPGIKIGVVKSVKKESAGLFKEITVAPSVDFSCLEEVLVIKIFENTF